MKYGAMAPNSKNLLKLIVISQWLSCIKLPNYLHFQFVNNLSESQPLDLKAFALTGVINVMYIIPVHFTNSQRRILIKDFPSLVPHPQGWVLTWRQNDILKKAILDSARQLLNKNICLRQTYKFVFRCFLHHTSEYIQTQTVKIHLNTQVFDASKDKDFL